MAVSIIETIKSRANAGNTAYIVVVKLLCDDYSDLPAQSGLSGYELAQGCVAHVINENKDYMIDSSGNWHVYGGDSWTNVYTKSETDALLDDKQDELTTAQLAAVNSGITAAKLTNDEAAIVELVDNGAKNLLRFDLDSVKNLNAGNWDDNVYTIRGVTITVNDTDKEISFVRTETGVDIYFRLTISLQSILSSGLKYVLSGATGGSSTTFYLGNALNWENMNGGTEITYTGSFTTIYVCIKSTMPLNTTVVIKPMICTHADYALSPAFVPYTPTNRELYEMIQALQQSN